MTGRIVDATAEVQRRRQALIDTARELQQRLQPKTLVRDAWASAKVKGADIAEDAVDAVKRRPVAAGGIIAAIAMFLAREPIRDGVGRLIGVMTSNDDDDQPASPVRKTAARQRRKAPRKSRKTEIK